MYAVVVAEKNSVGYLYNINDITKPELDQVFHLSPASKDKNPGVAYADRTLGEVDPETVLFLQKDMSPTGKPAVMFAGAWSSTISYWEFDCPGDDDEEESEEEGNESSGFGLGTAGALLMMAVNTLFL